MFFKSKVYKSMIFYIVFTLFIIGTFVYVNNNYMLYERPIAKVTDTHLDETTEVTDNHGNLDWLYVQSIKAKIKNGVQKDQVIYLKNEYSYSGAYDQAYDIGDDLFVNLDEDSLKEKPLTGTIENVKRDKELLPFIWLFILVIIIIGKKQGLYAIISLMINAILLSYALDIYVNNASVNLLVVCSLLVVLFTVISLLFVNGFNQKTYSAIFSTLIGTLASVLIAYIVLTITNENGIRYEAMDFLTRPYKIIFLAGLFVGSLGAVMDVAITMSSSIFELYEKNNFISIKDLKKSGMDIGKDIMGTMTNILFFAYISGSIPILILYLKNASPLGFSLSLNLSLEIARALAGGIGIVLTIPIGLYIAIFFVKRKQVKPK